MVLSELPNEEFKENFRNWLIEQSPKNFKTLSGFEVLKSYVIFKYGDKVEFDRKDFQFFVSFKREIIDEIKIWLETFELNFEDFKIYFELFSDDFLFENETSFDVVYTEFIDYIKSEGLVINKSEINRLILIEIYKKVIKNNKSNKAIKRIEEKINKKELSKIKKVIPITKETNKDLLKSKIKKVNTINEVNRNNYSHLDLNKCFDCNKYLNTEEQKRNIKFGKYCKDCLIVKKREYKKEYKKLNPEKTSKQKMKYKRDRMKRDTTFKIIHRLRTRILLVLHGKKKAESSMNLLGCTAEHLKKHLEEQFKDNMSWENYGIKGWHIDHIKPCASYDLSIIEEQKECFHYTNLQPLWWFENLAKSDKIL
jgi:hypothetical protein